MVLEVGIDTQYLMATLNDVRRVEGKGNIDSNVRGNSNTQTVKSEALLAFLDDTAQIFEKGKEQLDGVHFLALQENEESEEVQGFFLLRERKR